MCLLCLWGWYVGTSEHHDGSEQNKNFAELNEKFQILTGSFASYNAQTLLSYPTGYNKNNVACLTINGYIDSYVANAITEDWCHISFGDSSIIITTKNEGVVGHLFKIMIGKIWITLRYTKSNKI